MDILLIHHIENKWERELNSSGTSVHFECYKILKFLKRQKSIKEVILTKAENSDIEFEHLDIINYCIKKNILFSIKQYRYGWIKNKEHTLDNLNKTWCYASRFYYDNRDILIIPDWIKKRKFSKFFLVGCFDHACINDMRDVFNSQKINFKEKKSLIVK